MQLIADLHIHSRFSRATSRSLDFPALHRAALEKGIGLVGTGDFTHPGWMAEIHNQLEPAEDGLLRLRADLRRGAEDGLPASCSGEVRFVLQVEISNIYKKADRTRKNHNLVFVPDLEVAAAFTERLAAIGNLASDGRPILGLDARDLLEITLESHPASFLIPAHIWTPWFSALGSKSGFDSIEECFDDLHEHVFAVETGLSSDPPMNWCASRLDRYTLVSNSDAHSASKLGREANLLDIEPGFTALRRALQTREGLLGTLEFHPEEGKYHLDGHRKCGLRLEPEQTRELGGRCPECGGKITVGVMSRVLDLADREPGRRPPGARGYESLVPLAEVVGEVLGVGPATKSTRRVVGRLLRGLGPELAILRTAPLDDVERVGGAPLREALRRLRAGEIHVEGGYDGEFGRVRIFSEEERRSLAGQLAFLGVRVRQPTTARSRRTRPAPSAPPTTPPAVASEDDPLAGLDPDQRRAALCTTGPLLIVAGPGTGKTRTLVARIAHQVRSGAVRPERVLAIAFTNQAAEELRERIHRLVPGTGAPRVTTFHAWGRALLGELRGAPPRVLDDEERLEIARLVAGSEARGLLERISLAKQSTDPAGSLFAEDRPGFERYQSLLAERGAVDVDDLVLLAWQALATDPDLAASVAGRFASVSVDEFQDVNDVQADLVRLLCPGGRTLCAIGDPDQAIYGFRGARPGHFDRFAEVFPATTSVRLRTTYRLTRPVLSAALAVLGRQRELGALRDGPAVEMVACPSAASEAEQILVRLERIVGGSSLFAVDSGRGGEAELGDVGFGDVAVLCRLKAQRPAILQALGRSGIPCRAVGEDEPHDARSQKVGVMTMHAAKGREFEVVFLAGVEEGLVPLALEGLDSDSEEERRLLYVGLTRARRLAVVSHAARRVVFGTRLPGEPSRFLGDLAGHGVVRTRPRLPRARPSVDQLDLF